MEIIGIFVFAFVSACVIFLIYDLIEQVPGTKEQETKEQVKIQKIN